METLDTVGRPSMGLPPINHMDADRTKWEELEYSKRHSAAPSLASPLHPFTGLPHAQAHRQSPPASAIPGSLGGLLSPPESRRTSGDDNEAQRPTARQSLPSIHEALGSEQRLPSLTASVPPPTAMTSAPQQYHPSAPGSPADQRIRPFSNDPLNIHAPPKPLNPYSRPRSPFLGASPSHTAAPPLPQHHPIPSSHPQPAEPRTSYANPQYPSKPPALPPLKTTHSPPITPARPNGPYTYPPSTPVYDAPAPHSAGSMGHYSHPQYSSHYVPTGSQSTAQPLPYQPPASAYSAPSRYPPTPWRETSDISRIDEKKINHSSLAPYGESVKRHLESFDLEASLNEMTDGAGRIAEFSKIYRHRAHDNQRIGMTPQSMPRLEEVDAMLKQSERIQMSLHRMRDVVFDHHQANMAEAPQDSRYRPLNGYDHETSSNYGDESKGSGGFAGGDNKTRKRGRAAPPGRCHSCNRAETPEWRRGPDGARTLCNACGLHYAKLTRKMGTKQAMTSSNLRPKSLEHGSPAM